MIRAALKVFHFVSKTNDGLSGCFVVYAVADLLHLLAWLAGEGTLLQNSEHISNSSICFSLQALISRCGFLDAC